MSNKGANFEREASRKLSLWLTDGKRDDVFWRNRTRITSNTPNAEMQLGDMTAVHIVGVPFIELFNVEFKTGYSKTRTGKRTKNIPWDILDILDGKGKVFHEFWNQVDRDSEISNRIPLLIFKRDYHSELVSVTHKDFQTIQSHCGDYKKELIEVQFDDRKVVIFRFEDFFDYFPPDVTILMLNERGISCRPKVKRKLIKKMSTGKPKLKLKRKKENE